ncbi:hypothetical protein ACFL6L_03920 [candidate division KSB1 bacterium]
MKKTKELLTVHFELEERTLSEAGALLFRRMIEEDLPNAPDFPGKTDPYKWLSKKIGKSARLLRAWAYDWESPSGIRPNIIDFFNIIYLAKSQRPVELFEGIITDATAKQKLQNHGNLLKKIAVHIRELADTIDTISEKT